jgi:glycosyltransferase involved in cell wall biosynthesis
MSSAMSREGATRSSSSARWRRCGTPVVTLGTGGLPEQIEQGVNGFVAHTLRDLIGYIGRIDEIDRATCRETAMERFHVSRMVREYVEMYERVRQGETW